MDDFKYAGPLIVVPENVTLTASLQKHCYQSSNAELILARLSVSVPIVSKILKVPEVATPLLVHDARFEREARSLAVRYALRAVPLEKAAGIAAEKTVVVWIDLLDQLTSRQFRNALGRGAPADERLWVFVVQPGWNRHASVVQANALGATDHLDADRCSSELGRVLSLAGQPRLSATAASALRQAPGGRSILAAGAALDELFTGLSGGSALGSAEVADVGLEAARSVAEVGAASWLDTVRQHHGGTFQHCLLVTGTASAFAVAQRMDRDSAVKLTSAAILHDIGKAVVPLHILDKPTSLTAEEFAVIKVHPVAGHAYLMKQRGIGDAVLDAVRHHHEALDGSGYPDGLSDRAITPLTRVLTVCDVYAALVEARSYKPPREPQEAITVLVKLALEGKLDYTVVRALAQVFGMNPPATIDEVRANMLTAAHA